MNNINQKNPNNKTMINFQGQINEKIVLEIIYFLREKK